MPRLFSVRVLLFFLYLVASFGRITNLRAGDVSTAFLLANLTTRPKESEIYMRQPERGILGLVKGQIVRILKSVYGLPDAPRAWFDEFSNAMTKEFKFTTSLMDPAFFILRNSEGAICAFAIVHVDDILVACDGSVFAEGVVSDLYKRFPFGEWGDVSGKEDGVTYCGKRLRAVKEDDEIVLR
jgi:hypothetical protein